MFIDFSKAFDTVNHKILLAKLSKYGIRGQSLDWFVSYLTNRLQFVQVNNQKSSLLTMTCGVPQGSTLGPLLFLIYINDIVNCSSILSFRLFADDTNIFYANRDVKELEVVMNCELQKLFDYCALNKLSVNMNKTNFMVVTSIKKKHFSINIHNIERKNCIKYLGIYLDEHLNWKNQIAHVNSKIAKNIGIFYKLRNLLNIKMLKQLYYNLNYPYLTYGIMSWGITYATNLTKIRTKQNKCIRSIFFANHMESPNIYYKLLGILNFDCIVKFKIVLFAKKLSNDASKFPYLFHNYLIPISDIHNYNTRLSASDNFYRPNARTSYGQFTFKFTTSKLWTSVPTHLKQSGSKAFQTQYNSSSFPVKYILLSC